MRRNAFDQACDIPGRGSPLRSAAKLQGFGQDVEFRVIGVVEAGLLGMMSLSIRVETPK